jgi:Protein of unknown function (DUF2568)
MSPWNGALRFSLELASLVGLGRFANTAVPVAKPVAALALPCAAAAMWVTWNVPNDPSRGGGAPIPVSGATRLVVEGVVLGGGGLALWQWNAVAGGIYWSAAAVHYVSYHERIRWLLRQKGP